MFFQNKLVSFITVSLTVIVSSTAWSEPVARKDCFPIETLAPKLRPLASKILQRAFDSEALYGLATDLKPISSGYSDFNISDEPASKEKLAELLKIASVLRCGKNIFTVLHFYKEKVDGKQLFSFVTFNKLAFDKLIHERFSFFHSLGKVFDSSGNFDPEKVLWVVERSSSFIRNRGYGYLFGYPKQAVDFFVNSEIEEAKTGKMLERKFISIPTFNSEDHIYVWAVPTNHVTTTEENQIRNKAIATLKSYKKRRTTKLGKTSPVQLARNWFSTGKEKCDPEKLWKKWDCEQSLKPI